MVNELIIEVEAVAVKYRLARQKPKTLQEYFIHRLKGGRISYEDFWALKGISLSLRRGEALGIIGSNGAGKSTLLKTIAGVLEPAMGRLTVNGKVAPLIELGAGFDMELTGKENIFLNASILGFSRKEIYQKYDRIVEFSELSDFIYSPLKNYSSGMVSRLAFSIATEAEADILIIDEILSVGDAHFKKKSRERISEIKEKGVAILFVSHNLDEVTDFCDKVLWLNEGETKMFGNPEKVVEEYIRMYG